jgi:hypothetical protein
MKEYYRPQQEATVQAASEGKDFGHPLFIYGSRKGGEGVQNLRELGGLIFMRLGKGRRLARRAEQPFFFLPWILGGFFFLYIGRQFRLREPGSYAVL